MSDTVANFVRDHVSDEIVDKIQRRPGHYNVVTNRLDLLESLSDEAVDYLSNLPANSDNTWRDGGRPANINWALDGVVEYVRGSAEPANEDEPVPVPKAQEAEEPRYVYLLCTAGQQEGYRVLCVTEARDKAEYAHGVLNKYGRVEIREYELDAIYENEMRFLTYLG